MACAAVGPTGEHQHECSNPEGHDGWHRCPCGIEWDIGSTIGDGCSEENPHEPHSTTPAGRHWVMVKGTPRLVDVRKTKMRVQRTISTKLAPNIKP